jgi:hypothetical protein
MNPGVLLVDEPSMGLEPHFIEIVFDILKALQQDGGKTIILVEQNAKKGVGVRRYRPRARLGKGRHGGQRSRPAAQPHCGAPVPRWLAPVALFLDFQSAIRFLAQWATLRVYLFGKRGMSRGPMRRSPPPRIKTSSLKMARRHRNSLHSHSTALHDCPSFPHSFSENGCAFGPIPVRCSLRGSQTAAAAASLSTDPGKRCATAPLSAFGSL